MDWIAVGISTHAPRTGSDMERVVVCALSSVISTHAPRTGSDVKYNSVNVFSAISTHAPRTGSDFAGVGGAHTIKNFNPRSPHGERRALCYNLYRP